MDGLISGLQAAAHALATRGFQGTHGETCPFEWVLDSSAQLFTRGYLVTAIIAALDDTYTSHAVPR